MRKEIEIDKWNRKLAYETFSKYADPYTGVVVKMDITNLIEYKKQNNFSFYGA